MNTHASDIEEVKKYFFYTIYRKQTSRLSEEQYVRYTKSPNFLLSEKVGGILLFLLMGTFSLLLGYQILSSFLAGWDSLAFEAIFGPMLFFPFILLFGYHGLRMFERSKRLSAIEEYMRLKQANEVLLEAFEKAIKKDQVNDRIEPIEIENIEKILIGIRKISTLIVGPLIEFRKLHTDLTKDQISILEQFISLESVAIRSSIERFLSLLEIWMHHHKTELEAHENALYKEKIDTLSLGAKRLGLQRESIERVALRL